MNKRQAIKILNIQKDKLATEEFEFGSAWITASLSILSDILEYHDVLLKDFEDITSSLKYFLSRSESEKRNELLKGYRMQFSNVLQSAIEKVRYTGLENSNKNFLYKISDGMLTAFIVAGFGAAIAIGTGYGKYLSDTQNIELRTEIKILKDSISKFPSPQLQKTKQIPNNQTDNSIKGKKEN
jgi:hypothetical protein